MKENILLKPIVNYLLDILRIFPGDLPYRVRNSWHPLFQLAINQKIYHYLAAWSIEEWSEIIPADVRTELQRSLAANKARNALLSLQMVKIAQLFRSRNIPLMFIKGAAGLIRSIYPLEWRYLSDLDVLIPSYCVNKSRHLLQSAGYLPEQNHVVPPYHHHIEPYYHADHVGGVEVHIEPYDLSILDSPAMPHIWQDANILQFQKEEMIVPSLTDHVWIFIRTGVIDNVFLPRLKEAIEMTLILKDGYSIDYNILTKRAGNDNIHNIVKGMSYTCSQYMGIKPFIPIDDPLLKRWENWSLELQRKIIKKVKYKRSRKRFGAVTFLTYHGITHKILFCKWLIRYEFLYDLLNFRIFSKLQPLLKLWRVIKDILTFLIFMTLYVWYRVIRKNLHEY